MRSAQTPTARSAIRLVPTPSRRVCRNSLHAVRSSALIHLDKLLSGWRQFPRRRQVLFGTVFVRFGSGGSTGEHMKRFLIFAGLGPFVGWLILIGVASGGQFYKIPTVAIVSFVFAYVLGVIP